MGREAVKMEMETDRVGTLVSSHAPWGFLQWLRLEQLEARACFLR